MKIIFLSIFIPILLIIIPPVYALSHLSKMNEKITIKDVLTEILGKHFSKVVNEKIKLSDTLKTSKPHHIEMTEKITIKDIKKEFFSKTYAISMNETINLNDNATNLISRSNNTTNSDIVNIIDSLSYTKSTFGQNNLTDNIQITDNVSVLVNDTIIPQIIVSYPSDDPDPNLLKPSFGGVDYEKYNDGLTINNQTFDVSNFGTNVTEQYIPINDNVTIKVKIQLYYGSDTLKYATLYMNHDSLWEQSNDFNTFINYINGEKILVKNPDNLIANVNATMTEDQIYTYITFTFTVNHKMETTNLMISAVDYQGRVNYIHVGNALAFGITSPPSDPPFSGHYVICTNGVCPEN